MSWALPPVQSRPAGGRFAVKDHGFGTGPGISGFPRVSEPVTVIVYVAPTANAAVWVSVRIVFPPLHTEPSNVTPVTVTEAGFIALLNVTTTSEVRRTPVAPSAGLVTVICGLGQKAVKVHGFGTPWAGSSGKLSSASRPVIVIVYAWHWVNGTAWVRVRVVEVTSQLATNVMPGGAITHVTVPGFIASLNT